MIEVVETAEAFAALRPDWERVEGEARLRIFQSFSWCFISWGAVVGRQKSVQLWLLKWSSGDDVVILPTYIDAHGVLRFIFDDDSDSGDAVYVEGRNHHLAYLEIAKAIQAEDRIRQVHFKKLLGTSEVLNYLGVLLRPAVVYKDNAYSWLDVQPGDDFIASQVHMRSKDRADLKNLLKKAGKYELRRVSRTRGDAFPEAEIRSLRDQMRRVEKRAGNYFPDEDIAFVKQLYSAQKCEVAILSEAGVPVALNVLLVQGDQKLSWVFFYSDPRSGTGLYLKYLTETKPEVPYVFDFGVGVYSYKIGTFRPCLGLTYSLRYSKSLYGNVKGLIAMNVRLAKDMVKAKLAGKG